MRTGYDTREEFHDDMQQHENDDRQLGRDLINDTRAKVKDTPAARSMFTATGRNSESPFMQAINRHAEADRKATTDFSQAIKSDGELVDNKKQNEALREMSAAEEELKYMRRILEQYKALSPSVDADIDNAVQENRSIHDKMKQVRNDALNPNDYERPIHRDEDDRPQVDRVRNMVALLRADNHLADWVPIPDAQAAGLM